MMMNPTSMDVSMRIDGPRVAKLAFCICGVMSTLLLYGILQVRILLFVLHDLVLIPHKVFRLNCGLESPPILGGGSSCRVFLAGMVHYVFC